MRYLIASDLHGDAVCTEQLLSAFDKSGADRLLLLGDILYHGPRNDLPCGYAPKRVIALLSPYAERILCVRGNCDTEVDQMVLPFPLLASYAYLATDSLRILATHGHIYTKDAPPPLAKGDILLTGHTHVPAAECFGNENWYINPGSVSIPKESSPKSYILLDDRTFSFRRLDDGTEYRCYTV